jgi:three-Cys-motif partner protein
VTDDTLDPESEVADVDQFFVESTEQSRLKTTICTDYFFAWARIIIPKTYSPRIGYRDFYAGPGRYIDGTKSTPLLVLERAIADAKMRDMLVTMFNDAAPGHTKSLQKAVAGLPGIGMLRYEPTIITDEVGPLLVSRLEKPLIPTFAFIDPYGYKGLSLRLVNAVIKDWGSECLFFFNYNRINPGINNPSVQRHMAALFGQERLASLRAAIDGRPPAEREKLVVAAVAEALQELGGKYVLPFRFMMEDSNRTSHYLVFVSKNFLGYAIMRDVMAKGSSSTIDGVASFEYNPNPPLFLPDGRTVEALAESLTVDFAGKMMTVEQMFERHSPGKLYVMPNYREALLRLEAAGRVAMSPAAADRRPYKGKPSLREDVRVTFPRQPGTGARIEAFRSIHDRRAVDLPPSASARPTA